jgi:hypothetical protein
VQAARRSPAAVAVEDDRHVAGNGAQFVSHRR